MAVIFSEAWIQQFKEEWNKEKEIYEPLAGIAFNSVIAYGFAGEKDPRAYLVVANGKASEAALYSTSASGSALKLNWDLRAAPQAWKEWFTSGIGMLGLGMACARGALDFQEGDYSSMLKNPSMAGPFVKSFEAMGRADKNAQVKHAPKAIAMPTWEV